MADVRNALPDDFQSALPLLVGMGQAEKDCERVRARFLELATRQDHGSLVAETGGSLVGYAWVHEYGPHLRSGKRTARLDDLYVAEESRNDGAGRALFEAVKSWSSNRDVTWLQWRANESSTSFYGKLGLVGNPCPDPEHPFFEIEF
jgi:GNAT superfamily N-acetyltransferase